MNRKPMSLIYLAAVVLLASTWALAKATAGEVSEAPDRAEAVGGAADASESTTHTQPQPSDSTSNESTDEPADLTEDALAQAGTTSEPGSGDGKKDGAKAGEGSGAAPSPDATVQQAAPARKKRKAADTGGTNAAVQNALGALAGGGAGLPFGAIIRFSNTVGYGTFTPNPYTRRPLYDMSLSLNPFFDVAPGHRLSAFMTITKNIVSNADGTGGGTLLVTREGQTDVSDLIINYNALNIVREPVTGLRLNLGAGIVLPTSRASQYDSLYIGARAQATILGVWDWLVFAYTFRGQKNFHEYTHPSFSGQNERGPRVCLDRDVTPGNVCFDGGVANPEWSVLNALFFSFMATPELSFNISWAMFNLFPYDVDDDDAFRSPFAKAYAKRDIMFASVQVNYQINKYLAAAIGTSTAQAPKTPDGESFRFPFFSTNADNSTSFDFTLTGTF